MVPRESALAAPTINNVGRLIALRCMCSKGARRCLQRRFESDKLLYQRGGARILGSLKELTRGTPTHGGVPPFGSAEEAILYAFEADSTF